MLQGIIITYLKKHEDLRGWLAEIYRSDEIPSTQNPTMAYVSLTLPGVSRGPHEHLEQSDFFVFLDYQDSEFIFGIIGQKVLLIEGMKPSKHLKGLLWL